MAYRLKNSDEFDRLEYQSNKLPNYDFKEELKGLEIEEGSVILDACCGSGVVSRFLASSYPESQVIACDIGEENLRKAREKAKSLKNLTFDFQDLTKLSYEDNTFDQIICRYAVQHIEKGLRQIAINECFRCLKPGGNLIVIDFDGTLHNLFPRPKEIDSILSKIESEEIIDLRIGRKLPKMLIEAGFDDVGYGISALTFINENLKEEILQMEQRLSNAKPFLIETAGSEEKANLFEKNFLELLKTPGTTYFYNKFIVKGEKPAHLSIVD